MKKIIFLLVIFIHTILLSQEAPPAATKTIKATSSFAFTHAKIFVDADIVMDDATLLVRDGLIYYVGKKNSIPKDAIVYDLKGKSIYPGLIDIYTNYGMPAANSSQLSPVENLKGEYGKNQAIKAEINAAMLFNPDNETAAVYRSLGFGTVLTFQNDGIIRGSAALVSLQNKDKKEVLIAEKVAALYSFDKGTSTQQYPSSLAGSIALLRQTLLDTRWYKSNLNKKERNTSLEAINSLQSLPQIFETTDKLNTLRADKISDEFKMKCIIKGSGDEYQRLDEIKATFCKFIIPLNFPSSLDMTDSTNTSNVSLADLKHWEMAPMNPSELAKNIVFFALTTADLTNKNMFWNNLRKAIAFGLSEKQALRALTSIPAKMLNMDAKLGTLSKGKIANFIITSGNLFDDNTIIYENWIQGNEYKINEYKSIANPEKEIVTNEQIKKEPLKKEEIKKEQPKNRKERKKDKTASKKVPTQEDFFKPGQVIYPFCEYGRLGHKLSKKEQIVYDLKNPYNALLIKHVTIWTNEEEGVLVNKDIYITDGRVVRISDSIGTPKLAHAKIINGKGKHLTAGLIDEHSSVAISGHGEYNQTSCAELRMEDVINSEDVEMYHQLSQGITTVQLVNDSNNSIGAQSVILKLRWGKSPQELKYKQMAEYVRADNFIDFNVSAKTDGQPYHTYLTKAKEYDAQQKTFAALSEKEKQKSGPIRKNLELEAIAETLNKKRFINCHSNQSSETAMFMKLSDTMNFKVNAFSQFPIEYELADKIKSYNAGIIFTADFFENESAMKDSVSYILARLAKMGIIAAINSKGSQENSNLQQHAAKCLKQGGLTDEEAIKLITLNPAKLLHIDNKEGSIKVGKSADLVLWSDNPMSPATKVEQTIIDGEIYFDYETDQQLKEAIQKERERIIEKMREEIKKGAATQKPTLKK